ncbi:Uma2 family endonuclease [Butyrivibrio sp. XPD2002]|uniref:Uma2 family endonuclease n=1 Tax=Butyrivibrio sp. XPD2002 TaxID=1280665 RepID=UPI00047BB80B|nr:Uma2 family endonuclease [Butyrivibrio sp. XPD2002]
MDISKKYSVKDIECYEENIELIKGKIFIKENDSCESNIVINEIVYALKAYIKTNGIPWRVFSKSVALYVNELCNDDSLLFLPDVMLIDDEKYVDTEGIHGVPLFVAEIATDSSRENDYTIKLETYKKIGVQEYWIVDMQNMVINRYLASEDYIPQSYSQTINIAVCEDLMINPFEQIT